MKNICTSWPCAFVENRTAGSDAFACLLWRYCVRLDVNCILGERLHIRNDVALEILCFRSRRRDIIHRPPILRKNMFELSTSVSITKQEESSAPVAPAGVASVVIGHI